MNASRTEPLDVVRKQQEYEERSRTWIFVALVIFPLAVILIVAFTSPEPQDTTNQMGEFLGEINSPEDKPIDPDLMTDDSKTGSKSVIDGKTNRQLRASAPKPAALANDRIKRTDGSFESWKSWFRWGIERTAKRWFD